eukprot:1161608-Pelagomonas_calceolata.AAC.10
MPTCSPGEFISTLVYFTSISLAFWSKSIIVGQHQHLLISANGQAQGKLSTTVWPQKILFGKHKADGKKQDRGTGGS